MRSRLIKPSRFLAVLAMGLLCSGNVCMAAKPSSQSTGYKTPTLLPEIDIGISPNMFSIVEQEDVVSALKIWGDTVLEKRGVYLGSMPRVYSSYAEMTSDLLDEKVDFLAMLTTDYLSLENEVDLSSLYFSMHQGGAAEEYVLLIHRESGIQTLADLQGKSITIKTGFRENLAPIWLDTLLIQNRFKEARLYFSQVEPKEDLLKAVLPVFFGKVDACLVTRNSIDRMVEMNPQLSSRLRVLAHSEALVPSLFCVRSNYNLRLKNEFFSALRAMDESPTGQQVLRIFNSDRLTPGQPDALKSTRQLISTYLQLKGGRSLP